MNRQTSHQPSAEPRKEPLVRRFAGFLATRAAFFYLKRTEKAILRERIGTLSRLLNTSIDAGHMRELYAEMGRHCCRKWRMPEKAARFRDDPDSFLDRIGAFTIWDESAFYDHERGIIRITGRKRSACVCPFAESIGSALVCDTCCAGFQTELFETLLQKRVAVEVHESVLKGHARCSHTIRIVKD